MGFKENFKYHRQRNGWSQEKTAQMLGVARVTVTQWEAGVNEPRMGMVRKIAKLFGVSEPEMLSSAIPPLRDSDPNLSDDELRLLSLYRELNDVGRVKLLDLADDLAMSGKYRRRSGDGDSVQTA